MMGFGLSPVRWARGVKLYSRPGNDLTYRFPLIVALARLRPRSCIIDGKAVACDVPSFERIRYLCVPKIGFG